MSKEQVFNCLNVGYENKVTYDDIQLETGIDKRTIRKYISELREDGNAIISSSHFKGFYISDNIEDVIKLRNETLSRISELFKTVKCCDRYIEHYNQESLDI